MRRRENNRMSGLGFPFGSADQYRSSNRKGPELVEKIEGISLMGVARHGNVTAFPNSISGPPLKPLRSLGGSGLRYNVGLNLTRQWLSTIRSPPPEGGGTCQSPVGAAFWTTSTIEWRRGGSSIALHDPCAVLAVTHPTLFQFETPSRDR
ncbi:MAG: hypothetical protein CM1200mP9_05450 [Gammaproteobacteria bacterium]|nr:MAG: hypothetical protein CM1200mP9_05450 [Gammaproteobacteria bacterium]